ncbi:MAG: tyrosine-type recombinase/integrase, partial [Candidatus Dadabacteria bacterium]|nr:tyrosine-type recombinase/integrase [Candidatus Dadabacteria bacterium]
MGTVFLRKDTKSWVIQYKSPEGKIKTKTIGKPPMVTKTMAKKVLNEIERKILLGQYDMVENKDLYLFEFVEEYIIYSKNIAQKRSWKRDRTCLENIKSFLGNLKLSEVSSSDIDDYKKFRLNNSIKESTINRELAVFRNLLNFAIKRKKLFSENVVTSAGLFKISNVKERILTPYEQKRLLDNSPAYLKAIIICALNTGMRKSEIITLKWSNVDLINNLIKIEELNNKSKKIKLIPINSKLKKLLIILKIKYKDKKIVFLNSHGEPYSRHDSLNRVFSSALKKANIDGFRFHDLRHTTATRMVEAGVNLVA